MENLTELKSVVGQVCSENFSPTHRAKLIEFDEFSNVCIMEVVESIYPSYSFSASKNHKVGEKYKAPANRIWNAFFF